MVYNAHAARYGIIIKPSNHLIRRINTRNFVQYFYIGTVGTNCFVTVGSSPPDSRNISLTSDVFQ